VHSRPDITTGREIAGGVAAKRPSASVDFLVTNAGHLQFVARVE